MLNGMINSREVGRANAVGLSRSSWATCHHKSRQGAVEDARLL
jgi:hypothetical protein